jgi:thiamine biosynthesis lipoprotein
MATRAAQVFRFEAIGTQWEIETPAALPEALRRAIVQRSGDFEAAYSRFRPDSLVARMAAAPAGGRFVFPDDADALFTLYDQLHAASAGALDPLVGRDLELLGYDPRYSLTPVSTQARSKAQSAGRPVWARDVVRDGAALVTRRPLVLDVGAIGKGYLVDLVSELLCAAGVASFVVDAGGDMRHQGDTALRVGLEHPFAADLAVGVVTLRNQALCASATNRRAWGDGLHHILDARTGLPVGDVVATWVIAATTALADGLASALFFTDPLTLATRVDFAWVRMFADGRAQASANFEGKLFVQEKEYA